jgi:hypothetical protein
MMSADRWLTPKALIDRTVDLGDDTDGDQGDETD